MKTSSRFTRPPIAFALIGLIALAPTGPGTPARSPVPRFEPRACPFPIPDGREARCGDLVVAENRADPDSRTIRLPVVVKRSTAAEPAPDPIVFLVGGPGVSALGPMRGGWHVPYMDRRDYIVVAQRGTAGADPALECPEVDRALIDAARRDQGIEAATRAEVAAARACRDRLRSEGVDLATYTSAESAADLADLRRVLGYARWNLYGISYGTRLALEAARADPGGVRSLLLDSVLPLDAEYDETSVEEQVKALHRLFVACAGEPACAAAYPDLEGRFWRLAARLGERPLEVRVEDPESGKAALHRLDGVGLADAVAEMLANTATIPAIPAAIARAERGDGGGFAEVLAGRLQPSGYAWGMRYSVWCAEEMPFEDRAKVEAQAHVRPEIDGWGIQPAMAGVCDLWGVPPASPAEDEPVATDAPTLILSGSLDGFTPPAWARKVAGRLPRATVVVFPGISHLPAFFSDCATDVAARFFEDPTRPLDTSCVDRDPGIDFVLAQPLQ